MTVHPPITRETFEPLASQQVELRSADAEFTATLNELTPLPSHNPEADRPPFSFLLQVDAPQLPQGIYEIRHPSLAEPVSIFLVPIAGDDGHTTLQAIFN
ncbi:GCN5 family acetyltransferase [Haloferula helveola]|uniref:GCN5 family acetyltransferase n=1 Tax=Haloferula helveola TaxID=490095 RepID=A0ABM7RIX2_9BACT|nr:GCN5 family acetyltransferase [Haloferula helveola]